MNSSLLTLLNPISRVDIQLTKRPEQTYQTLSRAQAAGEFTSLMNFQHAPSQVEETEPKHVELAIPPESLPPCQPLPQNLGTNKEEPQGTPAAPAASPQDKAGAKPKGDTTAKIITESNWSDRFVEQQKAMHREFLEALTDLINRIQVSYVSPAPYDSSATNDLHQPAGQMGVSSHTGKCIQGWYLGQQVFQKEVEDPVTASRDLGVPRFENGKGTKQPSCQKEHEPSASYL